MTCHECAFCKRTHVCSKHAGVGSEKEDEPAADSGVVYLLSSCEYAPDDSSYLTTLVVEEVETETHIPFETQKADMQIPATEFQC